MVTSLSFADLLAAIYERHPEFATRSVFRRAGAMPPPGRGR
jgi:hypothetical protein